MQKICFLVFSWREYWLRKLKCFISEIHSSWHLFPWQCRIDMDTYLSIWLICSLFYIWIFVSFFSGLAKKVSFILGTQNSTVNSNCPNAFYPFCAPKWILLFSTFCSHCFKSLLCSFYEIPAICNWFSTNSTSHMEKKNNTILICLVIYF